MTVALENLRNQLLKAGGDVHHLYSVRIALRDPDEWTATSTSYNNFFDRYGVTHRPTRSSFLALGAKYRVIVSGDAAIPKVRTRGKRVTFVLVLYSYFRLLEVKGNNSPVLGLFFL